MPHKLGQVFLIDQNIISKIITLVKQEKEDQNCLEIGCGAGALTAPLSQYLKHLDVVEIDQTCIQKTQEKLGGHTENISFHHKDILDHQLESKTTLVANLPYYLSAKWIKWAISQNKQIEKAIIMVQKEFAQKLLAKPGEKVYTSLTVFSEYHFEIKKNFEVTKNCFRPIPKVDSTVITLIPRPKPLYPVPDKDQLFNMIRSAFWGRRKPLVSALRKSPYLKMPEGFEKVNFFKENPNIRGETCSLNMFVDLYHQVFSD